VTVNQNYSRTVVVPAGASVVTLDGFPAATNEGKLKVSKVAGDHGDLWISVGTTPAAVNGADSVVIPQGRVVGTVDISGLLQRAQARTETPDWRFTVAYAAGGTVQFEPAATAPSVY
jgi:hypothetical protein